MFKQYFYAGIAALFAGLLITIKVLTLSNDKKDLENNILKENAEVEKQVKEQDLARAEFKGAVEAEAAVTNDFSELDKAIKERGDITDEKDYTITKL